MYFVVALVKLMCVVIVEAYWPTSKRAMYTCYWLPKQLC